jgi:L-galactose dehydrogenase
VRYRALGRTGLQISELGFGASPLGAVDGAFAQRDGVAAVHAAIESGINFFDVSPYYGATTAESVLGAALHGIERSTYVLATKVGRYGDTEFDFSAERVKRSVHESLRRLGTDHLDLAQCHDIEFGDLDRIIEETLPALRELQDAGTVRFIGVTGYPLPALAYVAERADIDAVMSYCQYTLQDRRLAAWRERFAERGVGILNASPLAMGALTSRGAPTWHPASTAVLERCAAAAALCRERGADLAKLALQYPASGSGFASTVVGSADPANVHRNVRWIGEPIDQALLADVESCLASARDQGWINGRTENQQPGSRP